MFYIRLVACLMLLLYTYMNQFVVSHFCTPILCKLCCRPTQSGCVNSFTRIGSGALLSNNLACEDCNCSNSEIGCGWIGFKFNRVECTSCKHIDRMYESDPNMSISGCGKTIIDGALIYTS